MVHVYPLQRHEKTSANAYWAYVLVQYNDTTSSYTYGFTFKDSAGYGLTPTASTKIKESGSQVVTDTGLSHPMTMTTTAAYFTGTWAGFVTDGDTVLKVLKSAKTGDGANTCTVAQQA